MCILIPPVISVSSETVTDFTPLQSFAIILSSISLHPIEADESGDDDEYVSNQCAAGLNNSNRILSKSDLN